ncbi:MAG: serine hydrolase, partial [Chloroflexota bacterium]
MESDILQRILDNTCEASAAPGGGAIVVSHDAVVAQAVTGVRRRNGDAAIEMTDRFHIGSNTKSWTSTICADLVDRGLIAWEAT